MKRSEAEAKYKWDFSHLYAHPEAWKDDLAKLTASIPSFQGYKGKLINKNDFFAYLDFNQQMDLLVNKLAQFLHYGDVDTSNQVYQELEGLLLTEYQKINVATAFLAPEIKAIGESKILDWLNEDAKYHKYRYGLKMFFKDAPHILSDHDEELLSKVSRSRGHSSGLYDTLAYADRKEEFIEYQGKKQPLTTSLMMEISEDSDPIHDQKLRREASYLFTKNFSEHKHSFASIYEGILLASTESTKLRNYHSALEASLIGDSIPTEVYFKLLEVGKKNVHLFKNYHQFMKEYFQLEKFYPTDRQLKMIKDFKRKFSVEEAQTLIRESLKVLGPEYLKNLDIAWSDHHIDYFEDTNKRDGAYSSGGAKLNPIILMNWDDKLNSVHTLAHESGHSVHTLFSDANQPYPLSEYPIVLAEVASTVNEHLLFEYMYKNAQTKEEKIYLLQQRIFDLLSTFTRQIQFADFEHKAHELVEKGQPLTADILAQLFKDIQNQYGYDVFDEPDGQKLNYGWPRVSHFFHSPYYVYKYAVDLVASYKLYHDIKEGNTTTTLNFLKSGGYKEPLEILKDAGVDFTKEETYQPLIEGIGNYIQELKDLTKNK